MKAIGYVRVSTGEQAESGAGLQAQRQAITAACRARKWRLTGFYDDAGVSGKTGSRTGLDAAIRAIETGEAEALVAAKVDRLSRSVSDFAGLMTRAHKNGWALVALDVGVDMTTPNGKFVADVMASFAELERDLIGQRTKDALAVKKAQGVRLGRRSSLAPNTIRRIHRMRGKGASYKAIADALNGDGVATGQDGKRWYPATVRHIVKTKRNDRGS